MNERKSPCVLQDFVPFGAAAQKSEGERVVLLRKEEESELEAKKIEQMLGNKYGGRGKQRE